MGSKVLIEVNYDDERLSLEYGDLLNDKENNIFLYTEAGIINLLTNTLYCYRNIADTELTKGNLSLCKKGTKVIIEQE